MPNDTTAAAGPRDGFRLRGAQVTRLEAFIDAAFAFSVTLLVISIDAIPDSMDGLLDALRDIPAFAGSFLMIVLFWYQHARWSRRFGLDDLYSHVLGLLLVFLVLVYVYPLKLLFGLLFAWITGGWLPWPVEIGSYEDVRIVFIIYGVGFTALTLCVSELNAHALRRRRELQLSVDEAANTAGEAAVWRFGALVGALSLLAALLVPPDPSPLLGSLPGIIYFLMNLGFLVDRIAQRRLRVRLQAAAA